VGVLAVGVCGWEVHGGGVVVVGGGVGGSGAGGCGRGGGEGGEYMGVWVGRLHIYIYVWTCGSLPQPPILLSFDLMDHILFRWQSPTPLPTPPNPTM